MTSPFQSLTPVTKTIDHTNARHAKLSFTNGSTTVTAGSRPMLWPALALQTPAVVAGGVLSIPAGSAGNRSTRVFADAAIDELMRLDTLVTNPKYKCRFFATRINRKVASTDNSTPERIFQYGDQGSSGTAPDGGWVLRINDGSAGASFPKRSISFAVHTPYSATVPKSTYGSGQSDPNYPDPIYTTPVIADAVLNNAAGMSVLAVVDYSVTPWRIGVYINGVLQGWDEQNAAAVTTGHFLPPGVSVTGPGNNSSSNGFVLFNQSINQTATPTAAHLRDCDVWPIWIGEARDTTHVAALAVAHHANPLGNPYAAA